MEQQKGAIIVISAPSGTGKSTIMGRVLSEFPEIVFSVSATTRKKRKLEIEGVHYFFISETEFEEKIKKDEFVEWQKFYDYYYGTYKTFIENTVNQGRSVILEIEVKGALQLKKIYPESHLIFIHPPSFDELITRLKNRQTESQADLKKRIERAQMELSLKDKFDYFVENKELEKAVLDVQEIIRKIIKKENV